MAPQAALEARAGLPRPRSNACPGVLHAHAARCYITSMQGRTGLLRWIWRPRARCRASMPSKQQEVPLPPASAHVSLRAFAAPTRHLKRAASAPVVGGSWVILILQDSTWGCRAWPRGRDLFEIRPWSSGGSRHYRGQRRPPRLGWPTAGGGMPRRQGQWHVLHGGRAAQPLASRGIQLAAPCSLLAARCSLLPARCSLLPAPCSLLPAPCSLLPAP